MWIVWGDNLHCVCDEYTRNVLICIPSLNGPEGQWPQKMRKHPLAQGFKWLAQGFRWLAQGLQWLAQGFRWLVGFKWLAQGVILHEWGSSGEGGTFIVTKIQRAKQYNMPPKEVNIPITTQANQSRF